MKNKAKNILLTTLRVAPLAVCLVFMCVYLFSGEEITAESLQSYAPEKSLYAALFLITLYALKSLTIVFPIIVLNVLGGFLFEPIPALIINSIGVIVVLTIPYWIGRVSGTGFAAKLKEKYPKLGEIISEESDHSFFMSFFLRIISCLPGDVVSMYFGASKVPFWTCLLGGFIGTLPGVVTSTLIGTNITDPTSPMFWVSIGLTVGISVISFLIYFFWRRTKKK